MKDIIQVQDLHHRYPNGVHALRGVNVRVAEGEFVAIIGQNGSGKTTFAKHLNGLLRPTAGSVSVDGRNAGKLPVSAMSRTVGYCFQNPDHQIFCDTVYNEVAFGPQNLRLPPAEIAERVQQALEAVGLSEMKERMPKELSKGQRQRVAVASVLSMRPKVLVIDEPTTGQDYRDGLEMLNLVQHLNDAGHTILFITHDMPMVARFARRVLVFRQGQIVLDGTTREAFAQPDLLQTTFLTPPSISCLARQFPQLYPEAILSVEEMVEQTCRYLQERQKVVPR